MIDTFSTETDATETDAFLEVETLNQINDNIINLNYTVILFMMLWVAYTCKKIIHNSIRNYMDK